jgi:hypothetical protein
VTRNADSEAADKEKKANANASSGDWKRFFGIEGWPTERRLGDDLVVAPWIVRHLESGHII